MALTESTKPTCDDFPIESGLSNWIKAYLIAFLIVPILILWFSLYLIPSQQDVSSTLSLVISIFGTLAAIFFLFIFYKFFFFSVRLDCDGIHVKRGRLWRHCRWEDFQLDNVVPALGGAGFHVFKLSNSEILSKDSRQWLRYNAIPFCFIKKNARQTIASALYNCLPERSQLPIPEVIKIKIGPPLEKTVIDLNHARLSIKKYIINRSYAWEDISLIVINRLSLKHYESSIIQIRLKSGKFIGIALTDNANNSIVTEYLCKRVAPEKMHDYPTGINFDSKSVLYNIGLMREGVAKSRRMSIAIILCGIFFGYGTVGLFYFLNRDVPTEELWILIRVVFITILLLLLFPLLAYFHIKYWKIPELVGMLQMAVKTEQKDA